MQQFQSMYFTLKELRPDLFATDKAAQFIKVDGFVESLTEDMESFSQLHSDLDFVS